MATGLEQPPSLFSSSSERLGWGSLENTHFDGLFPKSPKGNSCHLLFLTFCHPANLQQFGSSGQWSGFTGLSKHLWGPWRLLLGSEETAELPCACRFPRAPACGIDRAPHGQLGKFLIISRVIGYFALLSENGIDPENNEEITHGKVREWTTMYLEILELRPQPSHPWIFFLMLYREAYIFY